MIKLIKFKMIKQKIKFQMMSANFQKMRIKMRIFYQIKNNQNNNNI